MNFDARHEDSTDIDVLQRGVGGTSSIAIAVYVHIFSKAIYAGFLLPFAGVDSGHLRISEQDMLA